MTDPVLYLLAVLTLLGTPGPTNTLLATAGAMDGFRRALPLLFGELAGYLIAIAVIRFVLGPVLAAQPLLGVALKVAVAAYLVVIAIKLRRRAATLSENAGPVTLRAIFFTTLLNPKALIFALGIMPFGKADMLPYLVSFSLCVLGAGLAWATLGHFLRKGAGERHAPIVPKIASVALGGFAGLLLASVMG